MQQTGIFRSGTSGLVFAEPNKQTFPIEFQDKHRLTYYASKFNSIEINSSFYKIPRAQTYQNWANMVPDDFEFTVKLWQGITHEKGAYQIDDLEKFMNAIDWLGNKKGCLLIQFPAKLDMHMVDFKNLLSNIREFDPNETWKLAVEFRHRQWYNEEVRELLDDFHASLVLHDMPSCIPPSLNEKASFVYFRFHGEKGDYRGSYDDNFLKQTAGEIRRWLANGKDVYAYFNNTIGAAVHNLQTLNSLVSNHSL